MSVFGELPLDIIEHGPAFVRRIGRHADVWARFKMIGITAFLEAHVGTQVVPVCDVTSVCA